MEKIDIGELLDERMDDIPVILGHLQKTHNKTVIDDGIKPHDT